MVGKLGRSIAVGILLLVLVLSLGAANVTVGVERTVLSGEFVADSLAEEDAYTVAVEEIQKQLEAETAGSSTTEGAPAIDELFPQVLTASYVQNQSEANIERAYAYLHGDRDDIYLAINTTPVKDRLTDELIEDMLAERSVAEFDPTLARMADNQSAFQAVREEFKTEQLERIQIETDQELSEQELETIYDDRREEIRSRLIEELETQVAESDQPDELKPVLTELGTLRIDAQLDPAMTYDTFITELDDTRASLEETISQMVRAQLDEELPDTMELSEQLGSEERDQLEQLRSLVSILDILVFVLPLVALIAALLIGWVTITRSAGLLAVGSGTTVVGLVSALGFMGAGSRAETEIASMASQGDLPAGLTDLMVALVGRTVSVFTTQSWLIVLLGVILIAVGIAIRRELISIPEYSDGGSEAEPDTGSPEHQNGEGEMDDVSGSGVAPEHEDLEQADPVDDLDQTSSSSDQDKSM